LTNAELALMRTIRQTWGQEIAAAVKDTAIPERFMAALIANETGGNRNSERFEPTVFAELAKVMLGKRGAYGKITTEDLLAYEADASRILNSAGSEVGRLMYLATSHGLTQIMGYHSIDDALDTIPNDLEQTVKLLRDFAAEFHLNLANDFEQLFRCWNSGKPDGKTFDPNYVPNGLERMGLYAQLLDETQS
jgi:hypothetical protein